MATNTNPFYTYSATAGSSKTLQKPQDGGDNNQWGNYINTDLDEIVAAVNALSDKIADANENELIDFTATGSAVNHVGISNAATGNGPTIEAKGDDANVDIKVSPKGTGEVVIGTGSASGKITTNSTQDLVLDTNSGTNSGNITITDGADGNISITPNGTGKVDITKVEIDSGAIDGVSLGSTTPISVAQINNININGNTISSTNSNGNIALTPAGSGEVDISKVDIDGGTLGGFTIDGNWTAAGQTCADLGSVTTCDINGGTITINGVTDASDAGAGIVGEFTAGSASGATVLSTSTENMITLALTAGDWDLFANSSFSGATAIYMITNLVTTSKGTSGTLGKTKQVVDINSSTGLGQGFMSIRVSVNSSTTYYLTASINSGSGAYYYGYMAARRVR